MYSCEKGFHGSYLNPTLWFASNEIPEFDLISYTTQLHRMAEAQPSQDGVVDEGIGSEVSHNKLHPTGMGEEEEGTEEECCGFCLQKLTYMIEPKQLPCSHIFCLPCLQEDPKKDCPVCG